MSQGKDIDLLDGLSAVFGEGKEIMDGVIMFGGDPSPEHRPQRCARENKQFGADIGPMLAAEVALYPSELPSTSKRVGQVIKEHMNELWGFLPTTLAAASQIEMWDRLVNFDWWDGSIWAKVADGQEIPPVEVQLANPSQWVMLMLKGEDVAIERDVHKLMADLRTLKVQPRRTALVAPPAEGIETTMYFFIQLSKPKGDQAHESV